MSTLNETLDSMHTRHSMTRNLSWSQEKQLLSAVGNVRELHTPKDNGDWEDTCPMCGTSYPCPTVKSLADALEDEK